MAALNETHDPARRSWIASANAPGTDFPIQNLPFGVFRRAGQGARGGVAIGEEIFDLGAGVVAGLFEGAALAAARAASGGDLTPLLALGNAPSSALRRRLSNLLRRDGPDQGRAESLADRLLVPLRQTELLLPLRVRHFTDMCISTFHIGRRAGVDERGQPITPAVFRTVPVGYDGRASSVVVSGDSVRRPNGTWLSEPEAGDLRFGPEPRQDYELELGMWFGGPSNPLGDPIPIKDAASTIFGYSLLNDWSARGIQMWETMLGPFLGKSLSTTVSPWIITAEALAPFRVGAFDRPAGDPPVPPHLHDVEDQTRGGIDIVLEAFITTARMADEGAVAFPICVTNFRHMYWTPAQMVVHHASNGCSLAAGDLIGSGTCSGPGIEAAACLIEKLLEGEWSLPNGESRAWLEDGDTVILRGRAERPGHVTIGFGEATGQLLPAKPWPIVRTQFRNATRIQ